MKKTPLILSLFILVVFGFLAWRHYFPNEEKRIRKLLNAAATAACIPADPKTFGNLAAADTLASCFTPDAEIAVELPEIGQHDITGRQEIVQAVMAARSHFRGLKVEFIDMTIVLDSSRETATAEATARATQTSQREFEVMDLKMSLRKYEKEWRIAHVETVRAFKK